MLTIYIDKADSDKNVTYKLYNKNIHEKIEMMKKQAEN